MADSDPISDYTPAKRRKITHPLKEWDEADDSGDDLFEEHETIATLPVTSAHTLGYSTKQFHSDINTLGDNVTQPTQPLSQANNTFVTQPTQPLKRSSATPDDVQVQRSSPPPATQPAPMKASFAKPRSFLASAMAPPGTSFRRPQGIQSRPKVIPVDDSDEDPEVHHSSDEETQGLKSNIRPTNFTKGGRGLNSSPNRASREPVVRDSPKPSPKPASGHQNGFLSLMADFAHKEPPVKPRRPADDMASAYGSSSRSARPAPQQRAPAPTYNAVIYKSLDDIQDYSMRKSTERMVNILGRSVQDCMQALLRKHGNEQDAMDWLVETESSDRDELAPTPARAGPKGVARSTAQSSSQPSQIMPPRSNVKANVKVQAKTIAERYAEKQAASRKPLQPQHAAPAKPAAPAIEIDDDGEEEDAAPRPRGRLIQRSRPVVRSPTPETSPPKPQTKTVKKAPITIESDESEAEHSAKGSDDEVEMVGESSHDIKLLKFFNEATLPQIADLCASPESDVQSVIDKRPYNTLEEIRVITNAPEFTKSGKKSRTKPIGDKIVAVSYTHLTLPTKRIV